MAYISAVSKRDVTTTGSITLYKYRGDRSYQQKTNPSALVSDAFPFPPLVPTLYGLKYKCTYNSSYSLLQPTGSHRFFVDLCLLFIHPSIQVSFALQKLTFNFFPNFISTTLLRFLDTHLATRPLRHHYHRYHRYLWLLTQQASPTKAVMY
jgi:hypothetical protein